MSSLNNNNAAPLRNAGAGAPLPSPALAPQAACCCYAPPVVTWCVQPGVSYIVHPPVVVRVTRHVLGADSPPSPPFPSSCLARP